MLKFKTIIKNSKLLFLPLILLAVAIGVWHGAAWWSEEQLLHKYEAQTGRKEFVEFLRRDKKELKKDLPFEDRVTYTLDLGLQWYVLGEYGRAVTWWGKGLELKPDNEIGWYNLGNAYRRMKDFAKAEDAYEKSISYARQDEINGCLALAELYGNDYLEKRDSVPDVYKRCLEKSPDNRDLIAQLGVYYRDRGDKENAIKYFDELYRLEPTVELGEEIRLLQGGQ
ncbi:tetratricopeptide repeat protein [Candidatus Uhrbacteria bacterium]|nr:tetratricopeptide repeat protein [Candidatus Uhrbacteria bacterium]